MRKLNRGLQPSNGFGMMSRLVLFLDADIRLSPKFATTLIPTLQVGHYYRPDPVLTGTDGTFVVARSDFERSGGFDELYQGGLRGITSCYGS